jgi:hypothetical protein
MNRKSLRKKVVEILQAANIPGVEQDVFPNRSIPSNIDRLPVILVYSKNAPVERRDESPKSYIINQDIVIECITQNSDDEKLSDELDDLSDAVIKAIEDDFFLEENCEEVSLTSLITDTEGEGQSPAGSTKVTFTMAINYYPRLDIVHDDLKELDNNFKINDNQNNDAKSRVILQE